MNTFKTLAGLAFKVTFALNEELEPGKQKLTIVCQYSNGLQKSFNHVTSDMVEFDKAMLLNGVNRWNAFYYIASEFIDSQITDWIISVDSNALKRHKSANGFAFNVNNAEISGTGDDWKVVCITSEYKGKTLTVCQSISNVYVLNDALTLSGQHRTNAIYDVIRDFIEWEIADWITEVNRTSR